MKRHFKGAIEYFSNEPRKLFLIDALGAALTAFSLFFVVRNYNEYFGMPLNILMYLSIIGLFYFVYSISCYSLLTGYWVPCLRITGIGNLLYCMLTITFLYNHYDDITTLGLAYFLSEILIIMLLVYMELSVASMLKINILNQ